MEKWGEVFGWMWNEVKFHEGEELELCIFKSYLELVCGESLCQSMCEVFSWVIRVPSIRLTSCTSLLSQVLPSPPAQCQQIEKRCFSWVCFSPWSHQDHTLQDSRSFILISEWSEKTVKLFMPMSLRTDAENFRHQVSTELPPFYVRPVTGVVQSHDLPLAWPWFLLPMVASY